MANNTTEYKFKVTNNLDKDSTMIKKFNFYIGLPYSKRKYRYMQVINFATNKEGQHLFNVVLGHSESSVAAMTEDILRGTHASLKPVTTNVSRITYTSLNVGTIGLVCNDKNEEIIKNGDWTGISGEYMKVKSFRTNGNDDVIGLIFDAADRSLVSARKNDNTNVVAKPEAPVDEMAKKDQIISDLKAHIADDDNSIQKQYELIQGYMVTVDDLETKLKSSNEILECFRQDLDNRERDISDLTKQLEEKDRCIEELNQKMEYWEEYIAELKRENEVQGEQLEQAEDRIKGLESDSVRMFQNMDWRRKYIELVLTILKRDFSNMKDDDLITNVSSLIGLSVKEK